MADLSLTPASVIAGADAGVEQGIAGETITAGQAIYKKAADTRFWKAVSTALATGDFYGIALHGASAGQPLVVQKTGTITIGGTVAVSGVYVVSAAAAGGIAPVADLASTNYFTIIGFGISTSVVMLRPYSSGVQKA
jgi:hypothetical protein